jgi:hypothetical protein
VFVAMMRMYEDYDRRKKVCGTVEGFADDVFV